MAKFQGEVTYITVDFNTSKALQKAHKATQEAYKVYKAAQQAERDLKTFELIKGGHIPAGTEPRYSIRKWDGVLQMLADVDGNLLYDTPKAEKTAKAARSL